MFARITPRRLVFVVLAFACLEARPALAAEADAQHAVNQLLSRGWDTAREARQQTDEYLRQLPAAVEADAKVQQSHLLVLLKQQRYTEAAKRIDGLLAGNPDDLLAFRAKIWLALLTKKYSTGLADLDRLSELLPTDQDLGDRAEDVRQLASFVGLLFGFLEGPAGTAVPAAQREALQRKLLARLNTEAQAAFQAGRSQVRQQHGELLGQHELASQDAERKADELREQMMKDAATEREGVDQQREGVSEEASRVQEEYQSQKRRLAEQEVPLASEMARLQALAVGPQNELLRVRNDIARLEDLLRREKEPSQRERLRRDMERLESHARRHRAQLAELEGAASVVNARLIEVQRERMRVESEFGGRVGQVQGTLRDLQRRESKADAAERNARKLTGDKRRTGVLTTRATALTTYAPFPLEEEKQKLLQP